MARASIAYDNKGDDGTITGTSAATSMPLTRVQNEHVQKRYRSNAEPAYLTWNYGSNTSIDTVALFGLTCGASTSIRVRISSSASGETAGNILDQTYTASDEEFSPTYGSLVIPLGAAVSARYVRFDITDGPATYVEVGRLFVGLREAFDYNFVPGAGRMWIDRSRKTKTAGGQTLIWRDNKYRQLDLNLDWVSDDQRKGLIESIDRVNGQSIDVLLIIDTESDDIPRDTIWGLITEPAAVLYTSVPGIFSRQFRFEERL